LLCAIGATAATTAHLASCGGRGPVGGAGGASGGAGTGAGGASGSAGSGGSGGTVLADSGAEDARDARADARFDGKGGEECAKQKIQLEWSEHRTLWESASCLPDAASYGDDIVCFPAPTDGGSCESAYPVECALQAYSCGLNEWGYERGCTVARVDSCCWVVFGGCAIGRPLSIGGGARRAALVDGSGWGKPLRPDLNALDDETRRALAEYWAHEALTEHASVASFARVILQLLGLGAPAELVEAAQRALADETAHALSAFGLASAYAGSEVAPSALDLSGVMDGPLTAASVLSATWREGCVAETVSALILAEAASRATDACVKAELERVAREELDHAELAWRTLAWLLRSAGDSLRDLFEAELASAREWVSLGQSAPTAGDRELLAAHGCLPTSERQLVARAAVDHVVLVAGRALLESVSLSAPSPPSLSSSAR
jgi:hypothetical protein